MGNKKSDAETERLKAVLERIDAIDKELKKRRSGALYDYNKGEVVHEKQMAFHKCLKRNRWVFGGNRSGKTECGAVETVWTALGIHPFRPNKKDTVGWVVSVSSQVQREVAQSKILKYLPQGYIVDVVMQEGRKTNAKNGVIDFLTVKNSFGGVSKICFKTHEQSREKFQGASLDYVWFDEEPPKDIYYECRMRVLDKCGDIWCTMTPLKGLTFAYEEIYQNKFNDKEIWYENIEWADNPFLKKNEIERMTESMGDNELDARRYGRFVSSSGLIYTEFDENVHVIEPFPIPKEWQDNVSIDPGLNNPLACLFFAVDWDGNIYVVAEHFAEKKDIDYHASKILALADKLNWKKGKGGKLEALIDSAADQRTLSSQATVTELFYEKGIACNPHVRKEVFAGISRVKSLLKARPPKLYIFDTCVNLIRELKGYWWGKDDKPKKEDDHCLDCLRYYVMSKPTAPVRKVEPTEIQKDIEKLTKKKGKKRY